MHLTHHDLHIFMTPPVYVLAMLLLAAWLAGRQGEQRLRLIRYTFIAAAAVFYLFSAPVVSNFVVTRFESPQPLPNLAQRVANRHPIVLVLTAGWVQPTRSGYRTHFGEAGWERLWAGIQTWERSGGKLMFTGGPTPDGRGSVAEAMAEVAQEFGVPRTAILVERESRNTYENLLYSRKLLDGQVILVTSALHMPRAMAVARRLGIDAIPQPCDSRADMRDGWLMWMPSDDGLSNMEQALHELIAMLWYRWNGWA